MTFQSLEYLIFLPVVFILYWTLCRGSRTLQNGLIVAASLVFYGWWDWRLLGLLLITAFSTWRVREQRVRGEVNPKSWTQHLLFICEEEH